MSGSHDEQVELDFEEQAVENGKRLLLERMQRNPEASESGVKVLQSYFEPLRSKIEEWRIDARAKAGKAGRPSNVAKALKGLEALPAETIVFITLSCILEKLARPRTLEETPEEETAGDDVAGASADGWVPETQLLKEIVQSLQQEHWLGLGHRRGMGWAKEAWSVGENKRRVKFLQRKSGRRAWFLHAPLTELSTLLVTMAAKTGVLKRTPESGEAEETKNGGTRGSITTSKMVRLSEKAFKLIEAVPPTYSLPMIKEPRPWTGLQGGGYFKRPMDLVKHHDNHFVVEALKRANERGELALVYQATNALQETPWQINKGIYGVVEDMSQQGMDFPGVPTVEDVRKAKAEWLDAMTKAFGGNKERLPATMNETQKEMWKKVVEARKRHRRFELKRFVQQKLITDRRDLSRQLIEQDKERFFFPYQLDFRGRAYAVPQCLNPQSDDMGRALLEFANGKALGEKGVYWLEVHLANMWGGEERIDKQPFEERRRWVQWHRDKIIQTVNDPPKEHFWRKAKKPWQFLAACMEWAHYCKEGSNFISHLQIAMDGSCNGFQHISAMLRDRNGAEATNLLPDARPNDIYERVAKRLKEELECQAAKGDEEARKARWWSANVRIERDLVKPAVMTTPYGAKRRTKVRQLIDPLEKKLKETNIEMPSRVRSDLLNYLVSLLDQCIAETCLAYKPVQSWLTNNVAKELAGVTIGELARTKLHDRLRVEALAGNESAATWQRIAGKKTDLRFVAAAAAANQKRLIRLLKDRREKGKIQMTDEDCPTLAAYLVELTQECFAQTCKTPTLEKWWQDKGRKGREITALAPHGRPIYWTSPSGFPVAEAKCVYLGKQVGSRLYGTYLIADTSKPPLGMDRKGQISGIVPDFVHSLDAAHMMMTVSALQKLNLHDFAVVHDSYAVHACDVDQLNKVLRDQFADIYRRDVLGELWEAQKHAHADKEIVAPPAQGSPDIIEQVRASPYFFS